MLGRMAREMLAISLLAALLAVLLAGHAMAQVGSLFYGPTEGHQAIEVALSRDSYIATFSLDDFYAVASRAPSVWAPSQFAVEVGVVSSIGPVEVGAGIRTWNSRPSGTAIDLDGTSGAPVATPSGSREQEVLAAERASARADSGAGLAVFVAGAAESNQWIGSWQISFASSGLAWRIVGGYRLGDVVLTAGYRSWPMDRFYRGPMIGIESQF